MYIVCQNSLQAKRHLSKSYLFVTKWRRRCDIFYWSFWLVKSPRLSKKIIAFILYICCTVYIYCILLDLSYNKYSQIFGVTEFLFRKFILYSPLHYSLDTFLILNVWIKAADTAIQTTIQKIENNIGCKGHSLSTIKTCLDPPCGNS